MLVFTDNTNVTGGTEAFLVLVVLSLARVGTSTGAAPGKFGRVEPALSSHKK